MRLGVSDEYVQPGFEDVWYYLWRERRLPVNVDPFDARLDDEQERARLRRVFSRRLDTPAGYALPLAVHDDQWRTAPWFFRDDRMFLLPGDSAMGYRLPLDSLPWAAPQDVAAPIEADPFAARPALPSRAHATQRPDEISPANVRATGELGLLPAPGASAAGVIR